MTKEKAIELLLPFKYACDKDGDPFFVVHFSRQEDRFHGDWNGLDKLDASIIMKQLIKDFNFTEFELTALTLTAGKAQEERE